MYFVYIRSQCSYDVKFNDTRTIKKPQVREFSTRGRLEGISTSLQWAFVAEDVCRAGRVGLLEDGELGAGVGGGSRLSRLRPRPPHVLLRGS